MLVRCFPALFLMALLAPATAMAQAGPAPADAIYRPDVVVAIDLTLPQASIDALEEEPDEYQDGTFSLASTDGTPAGVGEPSAPIDVGIRLKGHGSFKTLAGKAAFKIKFNHSVKGQKFLGLKKLTLNNMVQDPSMVRETLAYEAFRSVGVAAPRTGYAFVRVNGEAYGVYLNVETLDDVALPAWFDSTAHLYEGSLGTDVTPGGAGAFEVDEGDEGDRGDLEALIAAANSESSDWSEGMTGLADLGQMVRMWAVEKYVGHWDGYAGVSGVSWPNNFYLHSDDAGLFSMLPWGTDLTWIERLPFDGEAGLLFNRCLTDASCHEAYREAVIGARGTIADLQLDLLVLATSSMLAPWQALDPRLEHGPQQIASAVASARLFIASRPREALAWLSAPENAPPAAQAPPVVQNVDGEHGAMRIARSSVADGALVTRLSLPRAGEVSQQVEIRTAQGSVPLCSTRVQGLAAGEMTVRCPLSLAGRRRLSTRWLRLNVETRFDSPPGAVESVTRTIHARRAGR